MKQFFISYNHADRAWAEWIAWQLEQAGYSIVIQAWDFHAGSNFVIEMHKGLAAAERVIAVLSPQYLASHFTQSEWTAAFARDPTGAQGTLVPVRVRECDLQGLLPQIVYVDLVGLDESDARDKLLADVQHKRAKPTTAPAFPRITSPVTAARRFPGTLPAVWNVPLNRNPNFTGREKLLADLHAAVLSAVEGSNRAAVLTQTSAIHGLGGVGKTQLAIEYAYRHASEYDVVWWVRAEQLTTLATDFKQLAHALDLRDKDAPDRTIVDAVRRHLRQMTSWLLIFDNANNPEELHDFLPPLVSAQEGGWRVIITSRHHAWRSIANPLPVETMERDEAIDFLLKRTNQNDRITADKLADALGDLPLALEQAGAFVEERRVSLANYLAMFSARRRELLQANKPLDYPDTVATTWNLSFEQVERKSAAASALMNQCAFFGPDAIPLDLLKNGAKHLPPALSKAMADEFELSQAIAPLLRFSLIAKMDERISVHRLVQAVARDRLADAQRKQYAQAAAQIVKDGVTKIIFDSDLSLTDKEGLVWVFSDASPEELDAAWKLFNEDALWIKQLSENYQQKRVAFLTDDIELWRQILEREKRLATAESIAEIYAEDAARGKIE